MTLCLTLNYSKNPNLKAKTISSMKNNEQANLNKVTVRIRKPKLIKRKAKGT